MLARLDGWIPLHSSHRFQGPFHIPGLYRNLLHFRVLARKPGRNQPFDANEHTVTLLVKSEPKIDQLRSTQRFVALVSCIDNRPAKFQVFAESSGEPFSYGDRIISQGKFS